MIKRALEPMQWVEIDYNTHKIIPFGEIIPFERTDVTYKAKWYDVPNKKAYVLEKV